MSPLRALRTFLEQDPECRSISTQAGLAKFLGKSEPLIRSIETNRNPMSKKLALIISSLLGVDDAWLLQYPVSSGPIPARKGGELTHWEIRSAITNQTVQPLKSGQEPDPKKERFADRMMLDAAFQMIESEWLNFQTNPLKYGPDPINELLDLIRNRVDTRERRDREDLK